MHETLRTTTLEIASIRSGYASIRVDGREPVETSWSDLLAARRQDGDLGYAYRWLMSEYSRCEYEQRHGMPWSSRRRTIGEIVAELAEADRAEAERRAEERAGREEELMESDRRGEIARETRRVLAARRETADDDPWLPVYRWDVPSAIRFDTPRRNQGQIVEVSYGTFGRAEATESDPFRRVTDHSTGESMTFRRRPIPADLDPVAMTTKE